MLPTRRRLSPDLSDAMIQAFREDRPVELEERDGELWVVVDGVGVGSIAWESFGYPLDKWNAPNREAEALVDELLEARRSRRLRERAQRLARDEHLAAEGLALDLEEGSA